MLHTQLEIRLALAELGRRPRAPLAADASRAGFLLIAARASR